LVSKRGLSFVFQTGFMVWVRKNRAGSSHQYLSPYILVIGLLLFIGLIGVMLIVLAEAHEWAEARWVLFRRRLAAVAGRWLQPGF